MRKTIVSLMVSVIILGGCSQKEEMRISNKISKDMVKIGIEDLLKVEQVKTKDEEKTSIDKNKPNKEMKEEQNNSNSSNEHSVDVDSTNHQKVEITPPQENEKTEPSVPTVEEPPKEVEKPYTYNVGNSGKLFDSEQEANAEAVYMWDTYDDGEKYISGYFIYSTGDKWSIDYDYSYWE